MTHLLLIGFSCTGKTYLGRKAFGETVIDSDDEVREWIGHKENQEFENVYKIYMRLGRERAINLIEEAENALIQRWANDTQGRVISLGPGVPLRARWKQLRDVSFVVLLSTSPDRIYERMRQRRDRIFNCCPKAREFDNWDVGVIVDENRQEFPKEVAVSKIEKLLTTRASYRDHDTEIDTDDGNALAKLMEVKKTF